KFRDSGRKIGKKRYSRLTISAARSLRRLPVPARWMRRPRPQTHSAALPARRERSGDHPVAKEGGEGGKDRCTTETVQECTRALPDIPGREGNRPEHGGREMGDRPVAVWRAFHRVTWPAFSP